MSVINARLLWPIAAVMILALWIMPGKALCGFTSPFDVGEPISREIEQMLAGHPECGALILYSTIAGERPELLLENLETAGLLAEASAGTLQGYDDLMEAFRAIALHLSEHTENTQYTRLTYWQRVCDDIELCANEAASSPACNSARSAVESFEY